MRERVGNLGVLAEHVLGQGDDDRPRAPAARHRDRPSDDLGDPLGAVDLGGPLGERPEHLAIVELLEGLASGRGTRDLPDQQQHRRRVLKRRVDAHARMSGARSAGHQTDTGTTGELAVRLGHVRRTLLVARDDQLQRRVVERIEDGEVALARNSERQLGAVQHELIDEDLTAAAAHART